MPTNESAGEAVIAFLRKALEACRIKPEGEEEQLVEELQRAFRSLIGMGALGGLDLILGNSKVRLDVDYWDPDMGDEGDLKLLQFISAPETIKVEIRFDGDHGLIAWLGLDRLNLRPS